MEVAFEVFRFPTGICSILTLSQHAVLLVKLPVENFHFRYAISYTRSVKIRRGVRQGCCLSPVLFNLYSEYLTKEALEGLGDFKIGGQIIHTVKYADDLVLLAKEEKGATGHDR